MWPWVGGGNRERAAGVKTQRKLSSDGDNWVSLLDITSFLITGVREERKFVNTLPKILSDGMSIMSTDEGI